MDQALLAELPTHVSMDRVVDFDIYNPPGVAENFHDAWKALQSPGVPDIIWTPRNGGHWMPTRGKLISEMFADYAHFSSRIILVPKWIGEQQKMLPTTIDPPEHRPYRTLLNNSFAPKAINRMESMIHELAASLVEGVREKGSCNFTTEFAEILPIHIFMGMVDLPLSDAHKMKYWSDQMIRPDGSITFEDARAAFFDYISPFIDERMGKSGDDMLSRMINGRINDRPLTKSEAGELSVQVLIAGLDTVVNFLGFAFLFLARNPEHRHQLAANKALIPEAVDELFRRFPVVTIGRVVKKDFVFHGVPLKEGEMVVMPSPLHGMDERENDRPMEVDFQRKSSEHSTFGNGPHRCPGAHLARTEMRIVIEEWLARIPDFDITPGYEISCKGGIVGCVEALPLQWDASRTVSV